VDGFKAGAVEGGGGAFVEGIEGFEKFDPAIVEGFVGEGFAGGGGGIGEAVGGLDPYFDIAVEAVGGIGDAAEVDDGVEEVAEDDEVAGDGIGFLAGDDGEAERERFVVRKKGNGEISGRECARCRENRISGGHVGNLAGVFGQGHFPLGGAGGRNTRGNGND
jgi:hypothetical protein